MASHVLFDFVTANSQAGRLESAAEDVRIISNNSMEQTCQQLYGVWKGEAANQYIEKLRRLQESIAKTAEDMQAVAESIRYRSRKMQEAEEAARTIAQTFGGGGSQ